jgi:hypothetical protein
VAELAATAFAALASSGTAAAASTTAASWLAGTTVTTAAGVTSSLAATSGTLGALSTGLTVASAASALIGGYMSYQQANFQADAAQLNADQARLESEEKALRIRREQVQKVGQARVAFAGSGLDISSGAAIEAGYGREAAFETGLARTSGEIGAGSAGMQAAALRSRGTASLVEGGVRAAGSYARDRITVGRRG